MGLTSALVLLAIIWVMVFFIALPIRVTTQAESGKVEPGTHEGAPQVHNLGKKALITTAVALVVWVIAVGVILSGWISVRDLDIFNKMRPIQ
ncbi:DUF1467 family protein [Pontibaca salina]|uniref:DUF1467 family protein n=1 Tax=Pontibaca salina TaxID=2795731 RepID=A0A934HPB7_9RHOB|nr:DUF1467 family protein [Pontibaca salina]MBI6629267.1 DUF1467 family protein [Pontibaca salina]